ncbi:MAG TPA: extracellular solute-binding protein [Aggregatilineales bacterium]|nr:extracellular solute-binding protein [Aggregatilineales bacterium]
MRKLLSLMLIAVVIFGAATLQGRASKAADKVTITFWDTANDTEQPVMKEMVADCMKANPNLDISYVPIVFDEGQTKFNTAAQANNAPDVMRAEIAWTPQFADAGYLADITAKVSKDDLADFLPAPLAYNMYKGKEYGIPQVTDAPAFLYNKAEFKAAGLDPENPPKTMDDFVKAAQALTKADGSQWGFILNGGSYFFQPFMWAFGGGLIDNDLKIHIADKGTIDAFHFVLDLRDKYKVMPKDFDSANQYTNAMTAFKAGKAAILFNGPWATTEILGGDVFKGHPENLGIAPIPAGPDGKQGSPVGGHNYVIYAGSPNIDAAYTFIACMDSAPEQVKQAKANNTLPTRQSAYKDPTLAKNPVTQGFLTQMKVATNRPVIPAGGQIYTSFDKHFSAVMTGIETPEVAVKAIETDWKALLAQK